MSSRMNPQEKVLEIVLDTIIKGESQFTTAERISVMDETVGCLSGQLKLKERNCEFLTKIFKALALLIQCQEVKVKFAQLGLIEVLMAYEVLPSSLDSVVLDVVRTFIGAGDDLPALIDQYEASKKTVAKPEKSPVPVQEPEISNSAVFNNKIRYKLKRMSQTAVDVDGIRQVSRKARSFPIPGHPNGIRSCDKASSGGTSDRNTYVYGEASGLHRGQRVELMMPEGMASGLSGLKVHQLLPTIAGMLNSRTGGRIMAGICPDTSRIRGVILKGDDRDRVRIGFDQLLSRLMPRPDPELFELIFHRVERPVGEELQLAEKGVVEIVVHSQSSEVFYFDEVRLERKASAHHEGRVVTTQKTFNVCPVREGSGQRRLNFQEARELMSEMTKDDLHSAYILKGVKQEIERLEAALRQC